MRRIIRRRSEGLSLIEAAIAVSLAGVLLAVFIPTFLRELRTSKTSEAAEQLQVLYQRSAAYFATPWPAAEAPAEPGDGPSDGGPAGARADGPAERDALPQRRCLPPTAGPTPRAPTERPRAVSFGSESTPGSATWSALEFQPPFDTRYSYTFEPTASGCGLRSPEGTYLLTLRAEGDLDGDGERSVFERRAAANEDGELVPVGILYVRDRAE